MILTQANKAWKKNKIKFVLLILPIGFMLLLALLFKAWRSYLLSSSLELLEKVQKNNQKIEKQIDSVNAKAEDHKKRAEDLAKKAESIKTEDDADWNKKI